MPDITMEYYTFQVYVKDMWLDWMNGDELWSSDTVEKARDFKVFMDKLYPSTEKRIIKVIHEVVE